MGPGLCDHCHAQFEAKTSRRRFCSDRCRKAHWTRQRETESAEVRELARRLALKVGLTVEDLR